MTEDGGFEELFLSKNYQTYVDRIEKIVSLSDKKVVELNLILTKIPELDITISDLVFWLMRNRFYPYPEGREAALQASQFMKNVEQYKVERPDLMYAHKYEFYSIPNWTLTIPLFCCLKERETNPNALVKECSDIGWRIPWNYIDELEYVSIYRLPIPETISLWEERKNVLVNNELKHNKPYNLRILD